VSGDVFIVMGPNAGPIEKGDGTVFLCGNCVVLTFYNRLKGTFITGCPPDLCQLLDSLRRLNAKVLTATNYQR